MLRNTIQKKLVYEAVVRLNDHPTAEEIYKEVKNRHTSVSRATVYRILNQLAEQQLILRIQVPDGADSFDHTNYPHYHLQCACCRRIFDIQKIAQEDIRVCVPDTKDYRITGYSILFKGICKQCNHKNTLE